MSLKLLARFSPASSLLLASFLLASSLLLAVIVAILVQAQNTCENGKEGKQALRMQKSWMSLKSTGTT